MKHLLLLIGAFALVFAACGTDPGATSGAPAADVAAAGDTEDAPNVDVQAETDRDTGASASGDDDADADTDTDVDVDADTATEGADAGEVEDDSNGDNDGAAPALIAEGRAVPDVTLELDDGTTFVLADAQRPVMLVFWAEW